MSDLTPANAALAIDLVMRRTGECAGWLNSLGMALILGALFLAVFVGVQWFFAIALWRHINTTRKNQTVKNRKHRF